jgi:twinkle protein
MKSWGDFQIDVPMIGGAERFTTCPQCSPTRKKKNAKCLSINTEKEIWNCHHCGWKGTLKGGENDRPRLDRWKPQTYTRPTFEYVPRQQAIELCAARGIGEDAVERYKLTVAEEWMPQLEERVACLQFPYMRDGQVINIKSRAIATKAFRQVADAEKILYGLDDILGQNTIVFVEGEFDKLAFAEAGVLNVVSVPDGAPAENAKPSAKKFEYLENCASYFGESVTKIILAVDNDGPGKALEAELLRRLGAERCWRVVWPEGIKDANQLLIEHGMDALRALLENAQPSPIENVLTIHDLAVDLLAYYRDGRQRGLSTGFSNLDELWTLSAGQFTLVTGIPSHGKSEFMDQLMINLISEHGCIFAVHSPENQPIAHHLAKLSEKIIGLPFLDGPHQRMTQAHVLEAMQFLEQNLYVVDAPDALSVDELILKAELLVLQKGVTHLLVDPWNELDHTRANGMTETDYISVAISRLKRFARRRGVHVIIVAHPTKLSREADGNYPVPTPYDVAGSAHWRNKPDNCLTVWRDTQIQDLKPGEEQEQYSEVHVMKVRWKQNGHIGVAAFNWDRLNGRYVAAQSRRG